MKIVLVGYMGSGKSSVGKKISENVGIPFYDLDEIIEAREGISIKKIFETKGEIYFRKIENILLNELVSSQDSFVLALGGGTPCYANNHLVLQEEEMHSYYLKASIPTLTARLESQRDKRPILANLSVDELKEFIGKHLFDRNYYYYQAKKIIEVDDKTIATIAEEIEKTLA